MHYLLCAQLFWKEDFRKYKNTKYFFSDFKKNNGLLHVKEMKEKYDLYQQLYCGCIYSYEARQAYDNFNKENNK